MTDKNLIKHYKTPHKKKKNISYHQLFSKSKVNQFNVTRGIKQQIFGFQVTVDNSSTVQIIKRFYHTSSIEPSCSIVKVPPIPIFRNFDFILGGSICKNMNTI